MSDPSPPETACMTRDTPRRSAACVLSVEISAAIAASSSMWAARFVLWLSTFPMSVPTSPFRSRMAVRRTSLVTGPMLQQLQNRPENTHLGGERGAECPRHDVRPVRAKPGNLLLPERDHVGLERLHARFERGDAGVEGLTSGLDDCRCGNYDWICHFASPVRYRVSLCHLQNRECRRCRWGYH